MKYSQWLTKPKPDWLQEDEIPADPIFGLKTKNNALSVWLINNDSSRIDRIAVALSIKKQTLEDFEYVLFDLRKVTDIGIKTNQTIGTSLDHKINEFHIDLVEISAQKLIKLAETIIVKIWQGDTSLVNRILRKEVAQHIFEGISKGYINSSSVEPNVINKAKEVLGHSIS
jgi:hypothetical protein